MKIEQRNQSDRKGILMMPLKENIPVPKSEIWEETACPICGRECWKIPLPQGFTEEMFAGRLCTECVLRAGIQKAGYVVKKKLDEMMARVCNELCRYAEKAESQEELDMICEKCPITDSICWLLNNVEEKKLV